MEAKDKAELMRSRTSLALADGWAKYHMAYDLLQQSDWDQVLALLAQAETIFRTHNEERGLWRALIAQALLHWRDGMAEMAEARALAALQSAEGTDDGFAVGYVSWQLANIKIGQQQYAEAADYLDQAQLALDAIGAAPPGGVLAAAAQLCYEIVRMDQMQQRRQISARDAEATIADIRNDLLARLRQVVLTAQVVAPHSEAAEQLVELPIAPLAPVLLPPAEMPSLPWIGLSAWLGRLWRRLIYGDDSATVERMMRVSAPAQPSRDQGKGASESPAPPPEQVATPEKDVEAAADAERDTATVDPGPIAEQPPEPVEQSEPAQPNPAIPGPPPLELLLPTERAAAKIITPPIVERASLPLGATLELQAEEPDPSTSDAPPAASPAQATPPTLSVQLLGPFRVVLNDKLIESWPSGRGRAVFKYLLNHRDRPLARDVLMETFWPETTPDSARNSLNVALYGLRQALRAAADVPVILFQSGAYRLNPELQISLDVEEFRRCLQAGRRSEDSGDLASAAMRYEQAARLYQGDLMADDLADDWSVLPRERLRVDYLDTLDRLSHIYFVQEQYASCITLCQMILAQDSCREDVHCRLMRCYSRQNQHHLALRQYQTCVEALDLELGVPPAPATKQIYERIRRREAV